MPSPQKPQDETTALLVKDSRRSPRRLQPTTPLRATSEGSQASHNMDDEEKTPRVGRPVRRQITRSGLPPAPVFMPPHPHSHTNESQEEDGSVSGKDQSSDVVSTTDSQRSASPQKMGDLLMAERSTSRIALDGDSAEQAGGFLDNYEALWAISQGNGIIPKSLKVPCIFHILLTSRC